MENFLASGDDCRSAERTRDSNYITLARWAAHLDIWTNVLIGCQFVVASVAAGSETVSFILINQETSGRRRCRCVQFERGNCSSLITIEARAIAR